MMSQFLVKRGAPTGLAAHIADTSGHPLCKSPLNLSSWQLEQLPPQKIVICRNCRKKEAQMERTRSVGMTTDKIA